MWAKDWENRELKEAERWRVNPGKRVKEICEKWTVVDVSNFTMLPHIDTKSCLVYHWLCWDHYYCKQTKPELWLSKLFDTNEDWINTHLNLAISIGQLYLTKATFPSCLSIVSVNGIFFPARSFYQEKKSLATLFSIRTTIQRGEWLRNSKKNLFSPFLMSFEAIGKFLADYYVCLYTIIRRVKKWRSYPLTFWLIWIYQFFNGNCLQSRIQSEL